MSAQSATLADGRVLVAGGPGVIEAVEARGAEAIRADESADGRFDAVVVGWHRWFDFEVLTRTARAIRQGARLIGTNDDATYPTPDGQEARTRRNRDIVRRLMDSVEPFWF